MQWLISVNLSLVTAAWRREKWVFSFFIANFFIAILTKVNILLYFLSTMQSVRHILFSSTISVKTAMTKFPQKKLNTLETPYSASMGSYPLIYWNDTLWFFIKNSIWCITINIICWNTVVFCLELNIGKVIWNINVWYNQWCNS